MQHVDKTLQGYAQRTAWRNSNVQGKPITHRNPMHDYSAADGEWEEHKLPSPPTFKLFFSLSCDGNVVTLQRAFLAHLLYALA